LDFFQKITTQNIFNSPPLLSNAKYFLQSIFQSNRANAPANFGDHSTKAGTDIGVIIRFCLFYFSELMISSSSLFDCRPQFNSFHFCEMKTDSRRHYQRQVHRSRGRCIELVDTTNKETENASAGGLPCRISLSWKQRQQEQN
jgi:hypothetical protein